MSTRLLVFTAGFGEGHNAAARGLVAAAEDLHGPGSARLVDVFALSRPRFNELVRRSYLSLINRAPGLWRRAYGWLDRSPRAGRALTAMRREAELLRQIIAREQPEVLCSTYPLYAFMLQGLSARTGTVFPPHVNIVTDSLSINSLWWRAGAEAWFVPNPDTADVLIQAGLPAGQVHALGFPVAPFFADQRERLSVPVPGAGVRPRVLYIINSSTRGAGETARRLLAREDWDVTCTVGRNTELQRELTEVAGRRSAPAQILGWTSEIPRLLMTHHVVVSKAGGATTQEAIAARCPMLVNQIVPGQEEGNYELLRRHGVGALVETPEAVVNAIEGAFAGEAEGWKRWRAALERLARPDAAREIVRHLLPGRALPRSAIHAVSA